jgi:hypothetical protein
MEDATETQLGAFGRRLLDSVSEESKKQAASPEDPEMTEEQPQTSSVKEFNAPDLKCETVVVYLDRAEVSRTVKVQLNEGENEVIVKELSACIDKDSIR